MIHFMYVSFMPLDKYIYIYTHFYSCLICSIFFRRNGIGRQLFMAVAKIAYDSEIRRVECHVLSWNPATDFYKRLGAVDLTATEKWTLFRLDNDCIKKLFMSQENS